MLYIRQSATHKVVIGPVVAVGDGFTPVTNLDVSTSDEAEAILHDNGTVIDISGYTWAAITTADGYYHLTLASGISGTVGHMTVVINDDSLCLPVKSEFMIIEEAVYDAMFAASAAGPLQATTAGRTLDIQAGGEVDANITMLGADTQSATDLKDFADAGYDPATNKVTGVLLTDTVTTYTNNTLQTGDSYARIGAPAGASIAADLVEIEGQTDDIGTAGAGLTAVPWNASWDAEVQSECADALTAYAPPTKTEQDTAFTEIKGATWAAGTDTLEHIRNKQTDIETDTAEIGTAGAGLTNINLPNQTMDITGSLSGNVGGIAGTLNTLDDLDTAQDVEHDATQTTLATIAGYIDTEIAAIQTDLDNGTDGLGALKALIDALNDLSAANVNAEVDTALTDYDGPTNAEMEARTPTAAQLAYIVSNAATGMPVVFTTAGGGTTTAVIDTVDGAAGSAVNDQYNGRLLVFTDGSLKGVVTDITDYVGATTTATITAIPTAPLDSHNARLI